MECKDRKEIHDNEKICRLTDSGRLSALTLAGCASSGATGSADATAEHPLVLNLAHNLAENHITSIALQEFADRVEEKSNGRIQIKIFPTGTLGSETEVLEQLMAGVVDMTRVSAPGTRNVQ